MSKGRKALVMAISLGIVLAMQTQTVSTKAVGGKYIKNEYKSKEQIELERIAQEQQLALQKQQEEAQAYKQRMSLRSSTQALYNPDNLREISNANPQLLYDMMNNSAYQSKSMVDILIKCEESDKPINAVFLISLMKSESKSGNSTLSRASNNIASIKGSNGWKYFDSFEDCLNYLINLLNTYYLDKNGVYYNGIDIWSINKEYCPNDNYYWSKLINQVASEYNCVHTEN